MSRFSIKKQEISLLVGHKIQCWLRSTYQNLFYDMQSKFYSIEKSYESRYLYLLGMTYLSPEDTIIIYLQIEVCIQLVRLSEYTI
jgi:hypothetical protein